MHAAELAYRWPAACIQWVVAGRPSSSPAAASAKAPVQMEAIRAPRSAAARRAWSSAGGGSSWVSAQAGTITVSAWISSSSPRAPSKSSRSAVRTGLSWTAHNCTSYHQGTGKSSLGPKTSHGTASSNSGMPGVMGMAIRCMAAIYPRLSFLPLVGAGVVVDTGNMTDNTAAEARRPVLSWIALGVVYLVWGCTYLAIRVEVGGRAYGGAGRRGDSGWQQHGVRPHLGGDYRARRGGRLGLRVGPEPPAPAAGPCTARRRHRDARRRRGAAGRGRRHRRVRS